MLENVSVFHSSIRIEDGIVIYFDPYKIEDNTNDANIIFITHEHFDHFSPEDILKVLKEDTFIFAPKSMEYNMELKKLTDKIYFVDPNVKTIFENLNIGIETIPAYNINKKFHPKENNWLGYVIEYNGKRYYVAGDTDITPEAQKVSCDIAFLPCGGTYTMDYIEAAKLANIIKPQIAVPTHYGSVAGDNMCGKNFAKFVLQEIEVVIKIK